MKLFLILETFSTQVNPRTWWVGEFILARRLMVTIITMLTLMIKLQLMMRIRINGDYEKNE